ncbi:unnamed protein product [Rotaria sordida]|uniref:Uncharacterized protein n=2 Tax=Rotaria sordida TaxID=392033 RepID=A0A813S5F4_9BILA|nr:unnamed protein product [Rotaria sordida]
MFPQYTQRNMAGEIAIWLLITVGALLIPIIVIAVCCIRHQYRSYFPRTVLLGKKSSHKTNGKSISPYDDDDYKTAGGSTVYLNKLFLFELCLVFFFVSSIFSSYNGPYMESGNDDRVILSSNKIPQVLSCTNSINKKQHIHWPNGSTSLKGDDLRSIKDRQFTPRKQPFSGGDNFNTMMLNESPSSHRRLAVIPAPSSALSHLIQTAIIPAGSTITNASASLLLTPSKPLTPNLAGYNSTV